PSQAGMHPGAATVQNRVEAIAKQVGGDEAEGGVARIPGLERSDRVSVAVEYPDGILAPAPEGDGRLLVGAVNDDRPRAQAVVVVGAVRARRLRIGLAAPAPPALPRLAVKDDQFGGRGLEIMQDDNFLSAVPIQVG